MSGPADGTKKSLTAQEIDAWLLAATERRAALHIKAASLSQGHPLQEVFTEISALLQDALEEVRVMSEQWREASQTARARSKVLQDLHAQLLEQSVASMERLAQFIPPTPEEMRQAESRLLDMFRSKPRPHTS
jgi:hypothetical protein